MDFKIIVIYVIKKLNNMMKIFRELETRKNQMKILGLKIQLKTYQQIRYIWGDN